MRFLASRPAVAIGLLLAVAILLWPLAATNALPGGSDVIFAYHSAQGFSQALSEGVLYPRWVDNSNHRFGGATFIYYCPLPYYAVALAHAVTPDLPAAFRLVILLVSLLSGWTLYLAARPISTRAGALAAAALYVLLPYRCLDLYDRFAFAEFCAFMWFPLILLGIRRILAQGRHRDWLLLCLALTGLLFTHLVTAFMGIFVLGPYAVFLLVRHRDGRGMAWVAAAGGLAMLTAAVYLLPMIHQRPAVHLDWVVDAPYGDWRRNFTYRDEVALGYSPAPIKPWVNQVTTTQGVLALAAVLVFFVAGRRRPAREQEEEPAAASREPPAGAALCREEGVATALLCAWTFFLQIPASGFIWAVVPELGTIQFPWRFALFQGLAAVLMLAAAVPALGRLGTPAWRRGAAVLLAAAAVPALAVSLRLIHNPIRPIIFDARRAENPAYMSRVMTEYLPRDMEGWQQFAEIRMPDVPPASLAGPGQAAVVEWRTHERQLDVDVPAPTLLTLRTFHHPGWRVYVDGRPSPVRADNPLHLISAEIPAGRHRVRVAFEATGDRRLGAALSLLGLATIAGVAARRRLTGSRRRPT